MVIEPKVRGFICTTAHPEGCRAAVREQIAVAKKYKEKINAGKRVLVIGGSTGYGLASRIALGFGGGAKTLNVMFERAAAGARTATAGWYNTAAFEQEAQKAGLYAKSINGDAFSADVKARVIETIKRDLGTVDTVVYSLAAPRRTMPDGAVVNSVLKTVGESFTDKTIDLRTNEVGEVTVTPADNNEIDATVKVMGGEDWAAWIDARADAGVLEKGARTVAYSYIGPVLTHPIYLNGTIGMA
ncbi:MAG: bifunctional NADH-specific enoyl-ACP reductase/trans-2-enoyl-CoA reductase, partial [Clostridiales bacterium]|nr:bifunctional NADH-specific enoyl-ACP reductase/trans-2-enoyl-CoA reductase [Clostridiales bacterium]